MPKNLAETDIYSPSITSVDINNDVPNQQLANRTLYLKTSLEALKNYLATYKTDHIKEYNDLPDNAKEYIETIEKYKRDNYGKVPSIRELADAMNVSSSATVFDMLKRLKKKGYDEEQINMLYEMIARDLQLEVDDINEKTQAKSEELARKLEM